MSCEVVTLVDYVNISKEVRTWNQITRVPGLCVRIYLFIYFQNSSGMQSVYNQYFKNLLYCQPETTKRVVSCFSRLLN